MPYITALNKKQQELHLNPETSIGLCIEKMFEIALYLSNEEIGRLKFKPLTSLNNLEISPIYKLDEASIRHLHNSKDRDCIIEAAVNLFEDYTNGSVKIRLNNDSSSFKMGTRDSR
ncbi:MAG TPA: hypothetical protein VGC12_05680 [Methyloradius sp.]